ncbi:MAG: hypothetical protein LIP11_08335 [Clostridiales bacterium]|nr:hypothetical protein [Clostridiales bacterium]
MEAYVKRLETECEQLRERLALAEETLGKALAEMGKDSIVDANTQVRTQVCHTYGS